MSLTLNRAAYQKMIDEDIDRVLLEMPRSLERDHIVGVLRDSVRLYYDELPAPARRWVDTQRDGA